MAKLSAAIPLRAKANWFLAKTAASLWMARLPNPRKRSAGYFLLKVGTMDEALEIARQCPGLPHGAVVEVRPVAGECPVGAEAEMQLAQPTRRTHLTSL